MASKPVPAKEVNLLVNLILQTFQNQYQRKIDPTTVTYGFIPPRVSTRIGFEVSTILNNSYLKLRLYAQNFVVNSNVNPYRLEEIQDQVLGPGDEVYVTISDLPIGQFPILSQTDNPVASGGAGPYAIETEESTSQNPEYIELEGGGYLEAEGA